MPPTEERIITDHQILLGKPTVRGTRITVELILKKLAKGATHYDILKMYPQLCMEDINASIFYAFTIISGEENVGFAA